MFAQAPLYLNGRRPRGTFFDSPTVGRAADGSIIDDSTQSPTSSSISPAEISWSSNEILEYTKVQLKLDRPMFIGSLLATTPD